MTKHIQPVPEDNCSDKGPGSAPKVTLDNTRREAQYSRTGGARQSHAEHQQPSVGVIAMQRAVSI
jgi:hypothetical protein